MGAFINVLLSANIQQHVLEKVNLTLLQSYDQARILELAQHNAETFISQGSAAVITKKPPFTSANNENWSI